jgi:hypothetical protein
MQVFLIDDQTKQQLQTLKEFAEKNPYTMDDLLDIYNNQAPPPREVDGYWCFVPIGIKVVFTIELQEHKIRHMSVSSSKGLPNPVIVEEIMKHLGFESADLSTCHVSLENNGTAINVIEVVKLHQCPNGHP